VYDINILLVEDDERIREIIRVYMDKENLKLYEAATGAQAAELLEDKEFHMALLDVMLPDTDGWSILRNIRKNSQMPVMMLTARSQENDKLFGFDLGADDYVTKPFSARELMARIKALLKRNNIASASNVVTIGDIEINRSYHEISIKDENIELTPLEYSLLTYFVDNKNLAMSRSQILDGVWGYDYFGDERTVDTHVKRLRKKLGMEGNRIKTVRGLGYRMVVD